MKKTYQFQPGDSPILISIPHTGTHIPNDIACNMTQVALQMPDVDWHVTQLYAFAKQLNISVLSANYMRYVIDLNRLPDNASLYSGQDTTGLCPIDTFSKQAIYMVGAEPNQLEIQRRIKLYWQPYHDKLTAELQRIRELHGFAILWDAHSIASHVPRFFDGKLPDLNFGTADSQSCDASLQLALANTMQQSEYAKNYSYVFNGRFKGGYITRHYGKPEANIHGIQLEISQCIFMQESTPCVYKRELAKNLKFLLNDLLQSCIHWANQHKK
jgi:N-formylglutamate deformylase